MMQVRKINLPTPITDNNRFCYKQQIADLRREYPNFGYGMTLIIANLTFRYFKFALTCINDVSSFRKSRFCFRSAISEQIASGFKCS